MPGMEIKIPRLECVRCGWKWTPRGTTVTVCPNCKNYNWDKPATRATKKNSTAVKRAKERGAK
jgi:predicted RNA-binding Zn-ribbon protein involved in translation (DUF1610 family)